MVLGDNLWIQVMFIHHRFDISAPDACRAQGYLCSRIFCSDIDRGIVNNVHTSVFIICGLFTHYILYLWMFLYFKSDFPQEWGDIK